MNPQSPNSSGKKDVIYIDIEDDITSIIDKVKEAKAPIVALVPPKRIGVLQSVVNLKLLRRAAEGVHKRVVLITNDNALSAHAAGIAVPVAKNLQSKPEIPELTALEVDDEEVINGEELPIGELAATAPAGEAAAKSPLGTSTSGVRKPAGVTPLAATAAANAPKKGSKVPNFDKFRKKLFLIIGGSVLLIVFLVWALFFAPRATVAITANTNLMNIDQVLQLRPNATLDTAQNILPALVQQSKKTTSVDFEATGKKDVGERATGTVKFSTDSIGKLGTTIPAGTVLTASGNTYVTDSSVTITIANYNNATTSITATDRGAKFNGASGSASGSPSGISATLPEPTSGGTDKTVTVVTQADIDKAKQQLQAQDANSIRSELRKQFGSDAIIINESFTSVAADPVSSPALDQEAAGKAKLTAETTFTLVGVKRSDLKSLFDAYLKKQLEGTEDQKIYASGDSSASFSQFAGVEGGYSVKASAQAQVGPQINEEALKKQLVGRRAGEIQQQLETINGIEDVETSFFPFWVTKAPGENKITIKFVLKNDAN